MTCGRTLTIKGYRNNIEHGLHAAYDDLFSTLAASLAEVLNDSDNVPRLNQAVPIVLSGGTVLPPGSRERFETILGEISLPRQISKVVLARNPIGLKETGARAALPIWIEFMKHVPVEGVQIAILDHGARRLHEAQ